MWEETMVDNCESCGSGGNGSTVWIQFVVEWLWCCQWWS